MVRHKETGELFTVLGLTEWGDGWINNLNTDGNAKVRDAKGETRWIEGHRLEPVFYDHAGKITPEYEQGPQRHEAD